MSIIIHISVEDIGESIQDYDQIKVYRSFDIGLEPSEITSEGTRIDLVGDVPYYSYTDTSGHIEYVYYYSLYNSGTLDESNLSEGFSGWVPVLSYTDSSFPAEFSVSHLEEDIINGVRAYLGDRKTIQRDYLNPSCETLYQYVSNDGTTYKLQTNPGWPVKIVKDGVEITDSDEVSVNNYEYVTFKNSTISTVSGVVDIWYETFRHSDRRILDTYTTVPYPYPLTESNTPPDVKKLQTAVVLLEGELRDLYNSVDGSFSITGDTSFNPSSVLSAREKDLERLRKKLDDMVDDVVIRSFSGIRIE